MKRVGPGDRLEGRGPGLLARVGGEVVAGELDGPEVDRDRVVAGPAAERPEDVSERRRHLGPGEVADRLVDIGQQPGDQPGGRRRRLDRVGHERQRAAVERLADELGCEIQDPVAEAVVGSRGAVVGLVGVQDVQLAGQADPACAAVAERLHAGGGDADRVAVVPVRRVRRVREVHLGQLETGGAGPEPDRVAPPAAESFKTTGAGAA